MANQVQILRIPEIPEEERTPAVIALLAVCNLQQEQMALQQEQIAQQQEQIAQQQEQIHLLKEQVQGLKDEIARLKGHNPKPKIKPSRLEQNSDKEQQEQEESKGKRPGSGKKSKKKTLKIHETVVIQPAEVPVGSRFMTAESSKIPSERKRERICTR